MIVDEKMLECRAVLRIPGATTTTSAARQAAFPTIYGIMVSHSVGNDIKKCKRTFRAADM